MGLSAYPIRPASLLGRLTQQRMDIGSGVGSPMTGNNPMGLVLRSSGSQRKSRRPSIGEIIVHTAEILSTHKHQPKMDPMRWCLVAGASGAI